MKTELIPKNVIKLRVEGKTELKGAPLDNLAGTLYNAMLLLPKAETKKFDEIGMRQRLQIIGKSAECLVDDTVYTQFKHETSKLGYALSLLVRNVNNEYEHMQDSKRALEDECNYLMDMHEKHTSPYQGKI